MRVVIFTAGSHIYANKVVKDLILKSKLEIVLVVESGVVYPNKNDFQALFKYIKTAGISYSLNQIFKVLLFDLFSNVYKFIPSKNYDNPFFPYKYLVSNKIKIIKEKDINNGELAKILRNKKTDLFISIYFNQIFKDPLLSLPKKGTINMHPALLPSYRGISPVFWSLSNKEKFSGVTIHTITDRQIDKGKILAQKKIAILSDDTEHSLYMRSTNEGIMLLKTVLKKIEKGIVLRGKIDKKIKPSYYSIPTITAVRKFKKNGRIFFTLKELLRS